MLSRVLGQGKQIEISKSNFSSKVNSTGVQELYITELGTENCWEARIGVKAKKCEQEEYNGELWSLSRKP